MSCKKKGLPFKEDLGLKILALNDALEIRGRS